jgi:hypothetical protein
MGVPGIASMGSELVGKVPCCANLSTRVTIVTQATEALDEGEEIDSIQHAFVERERKPA